MSLGFGQYITSSEKLSYIVKIQNAFTFSQKLNNTLKFAKNSQLSHDKKYYFKIRFSKTEFINNITIKLVNNEGKFQILDNFRILQRNELSDKHIWETIVTINLLNYDFLTIENDNNSVESKDVELEVYNVLNILDEINKPNIYKIGVQGKPNQLLCLNGYPIRINNSGLFEYENTKDNITFLGIDSNEEVIIDYQYKEV